MQNLTMGLIFIPMVLAVVIYLLDRRSINRISLIIQPVLFIMTLYLFKEVYSSGDISFVLSGWERGVGIGLRIDKTSIIFMLLTTIGMTYSVAFDWKSHRDDHKYIFFLLFIEGAILALFQAADIFTLFILLELITILACILITYKKEGISVKAGLYYLLVNSVGMTIYLMGVILLYNTEGLLDMVLLKEVLTSAPLQTMHYVVLGTFITAFSIKSALFPVGSWLPLAHGSAPTQISALLSGLLVKIGIYGLIRMIDMFGYGAYYDILLIIGIVTSIGGVSMAMLQKDIKLILAYHTISQVGLMVIGLASGSAVGHMGSLLHMTNHFFFKSLLFLGVGVVILRYRTRDVRKIRGVFKTSPAVSIALMIGVLGITGAPLFNGSLSKYLISQSIYDNILGYSLYVINVGTLISFIKFSQIFFGVSKRLVEPVVDRWKSGSVIGMAFLMLLTYPAELMYLKYSGLVQITYETLINSAIKYGISALIAYFIYSKILNPLLKKRPEIGLGRLGFQGANTMVLVFLTLMWGYFLVILP